MLFLLENYVVRPVFAAGFFIICVFFKIWVVVG